jgi:hypothetical protein
MLKRWDVRVYDVGFLMAALDYVLDFMDLDLKIDGGRFWRSPKLYVKALVLKEVFKASLRHAGKLSLTYLGVRIPKSTLHYWEMRHGDIVGEVLKIIFRLLNLIEYSVVDSTKLSDWLGRLHELFLDVRVKSGSTIFPVHAELTSSEVEFVRGIPDGVGFMLGDGVFDAKPVLNTIVSKGYPS